MGRPRCLTRGPRELFRRRGNRGRVFVGTRGITAPDETKEIMGLTPDRDREFTDFVTLHRPALVRTARLVTAGDTHRA